MSTQIHNLILKVSLSRFAKAYSTMCFLFSVFCNFFTSYVFAYPVFCFILSEIKVNELRRKQEIQIITKQEIYVDKTIAKEKKAKDKKTRNKKQRAYCRIGLKYTVSIFCRL